MKYSILFSFLFIYLIVGCDSSTEFSGKVNNQIQTADAAKIQYGSNPYIIVSDLETLKGLIKPDEMEETKPLDEQDFPIEITFYNKDEQTIKIGVEFGHVRYVHYQLDGSYEYKTLLTNSLDEYLSGVINANETLTIYK